MQEQGNRIIVHCSPLYTADLNGSADEPSTATIRVATDGAKFRSRTSPAQDDKSHDLLPGVLIYTLSLLFGGCFVITP